MSSLIGKGLDITKGLVKKSIDVAKKPGKVLNNKQDQKEPEFKLENNMKYYLCSLCRTSFGPVVSSVSDKFSSIKIVKGFTNFIVKSDIGVPINLRKCPQCNIWICGNCWNHEKYKCKKCEPFIETLAVSEGYPHLRTDYSNFKAEFYYTCDRCKRENGPGVNIEDYARFLYKCPECGDWACYYCWNHEIGKCFNCAPSSQPEVRFEKSIATKFVEKAILICSQCRQETGSISKKKWKAGEEKKHLVQCSTCGKWVCGECWNEEERQCIFCKPYFPPETRAEKKGLNEYIYFICALCRNEHSPITQKDWKEMAKTGFRAVGVVGSITGNPALVATGFIGAVAAGKGDSTVSMATIKRKSLKEIDYSKKFLARCPECKKWVCLECWDKLRGQCKNCKHKVEIEEKSKFIPPTYVVAGDHYEGGKIEIKDSVVTRTDFGEKSNKEIKIEDSIVQSSIIERDSAVEETVMPKCSNCNKELQEEWTVCPSCGVTIVIKCLKCGNELERDWNACPYCGTK